jgi:hypothetical protein
MELLCPYDSIQYQHNLANIQRLVFKYVAKLTWNINVFEHYR